MEVLGYEAPVQVPGLPPQGGQHRHLARHHHLLQEKGSHTASAGEHRTVLGPRAEHCQGRAGGLVPPPRRHSFVLGAGFGQLKAFQKKVKVLPLFLVTYSTLGTPL